MPDHITLAQRHQALVRQQANPRAIQKTEDALLESEEVITEAELEEALLENPDTLKEIVLSGDPRALYLIRSATPQGGYQFDTTVLEAALERHEEAVFPALAEFPHLGRFQSLRTGKRLGLQAIRPGTNPSTLLALMKDQDIAAQHMEMKEEVLTPAPQGHRSYRTRSMSAYNAVILSSEEVALEVVRSPELWSAPGTQENQEGLRLAARTWARAALEAARRPELLSLPDEKGYTVGEEIEWVWSQKLAAKMRRETTELDRGNYLSREERELAARVYSGGLTPTRKVARSPDEVLPMEQEERRRAPFAGQLTLPEETAPPVEELTPEALDALIRSNFQQALKEVAKLFPQLPSHTSRSNNPFWTPAWSRWRDAPPSVGMEIHRSSGGAAVSCFVIRRNGEVLLGFDASGNTYQSVSAEDPYAPSGRVERLQPADVASKRDISELTDLTIRLKVVSDVVRTQTRSLVETSRTRG